MKTFITISWILVVLSLIGSGINLVEGTFDTLVFLGTLIFVFYGAFTYRVQKLIK